MKIVTNSGLSFKQGTVFHRIGGSSLDNLRLKPVETTLIPPGFSVLTDGTPREAAKQIRNAFPSAIKLHKAAETIGSATLEEIRAIGFDVAPDPTRKFPNHARVIHPQGLAGFTDENLEKLSKVFKETTA
ncbi:hypothetical protein L0337_38010 [candidate division KSB1 bacterium]|nr:hypothetical protein [candidate division KSB1 bacterium]